MRVVSPTDGLGALLAAAQGAKLAASLLRFASACAAAFAGLLLLALALAAFERGGGSEPSQISASAYLDFDLSVLRTLADRKPPLLSMWSRRPDWQLPRAAPTAARIVPLRDAWSAVTSGKSRFRTAARGAADALPFLLGGVALALLAAGIAGAAAQFRRRELAIAAAAALIAGPAWLLLDPAIFYDRTRSLGLGLSAALFVAAFAGAMSGAAARALFAPAPQAQYLGALRGRPAFLAAARMAVLDATAWLVPLVPALAAAAVFVCAKADQDPAVISSSGLGALIRAAMREPSAAERLSSCALVLGALLLLWFVGHRLVLEVREALR